MRNFEDPFCDIEPPTPIAHDDYVQLRDDIYSRGERDAKFSDTELTLTTLELYKVTQYILQAGVRQGVVEGYNYGRKRGFKFGMFWGLISAAVGAGIYFLL